MEQKEDLNTGNTTLIFAVHDPPSSQPIYLPQFVQPGPDKWLVMRQGTLPDNAVPLQATVGPLTIARNPAVTSSLSSSTTSITRTTAAPTTSTYKTSITPTIAPYTDDSTLTTGAIVGIAVGIFVFVGAILAVVYFARRRLRTSSSDDTVANNTPVQETGFFDYHLSKYAGLPGEQHDSVLNVYGQPPNEHQLHPPNEHQIQPPNEHQLQLPNEHELYLPNEHELDLPHQHDYESVSRPGRRYPPNED
ncbi:hypothetical protein EC973_005813 [Apophysomyces ossiformis]|uniref:Uncharacterized protein n=1 Tax=Apophysomyces ossiformis TaxID=679940 RepID=A0A8H7BVV1_9FUNG|nr:hypothetical protein EC973_005813 [Apophysomyces ossiformis]